MSSAATAAAAAVRMLLDTNIVSELTRSQPHRLVMARYQDHHAHLGLPAPVLQEVQFGALRLPDGARRARLLAFINGALLTLPVLDYNRAAALRHAALRADAEQRGRPLPWVDSQIAAIALIHGCTLVTRNTRDFESIPGLPLADWFQA
jgi:tRNA(fMet)-specific endonuclease VapC